MSKIINIISNKNKLSRRTAKVLSDKLRKYNYKPTEDYNENADLNICIGGDGAFLRAVRNFNFPTIPFIGVNTGNLGFFQEIQPEQVEEFVTEYDKKKYNIEKNYLVQCIVETRDRGYTLLGLNEVVVRGNKSAVIHLNVYIDDNHLETFSGDGMIISTPAGSTAYNFSAGGSIIFPNLKALQLTPISPINSKAYRSLTNSYITPGDLDIKIVPTARYRSQTDIIIDGQIYRYRAIESITFRLSNRYINRIVLDRHTYWNNLKDKFL